MKRERPGRKRLDTAEGTSGDEVCAERTSTTGPSRRRFVEPELVRHEALTRITLVSDFNGGGGGQGTFFG